MHFGAAGAVRTNLVTFSILQPPRILFGRGEAAKAPALALGFGKRGAVVHGQDASRAAWLLDALAKAGAETLALPCPAEPTLAMLEAALVPLRAFRPDWVLALGGGAALDFGKALAGLAPGAGAPLDHLEVVGRGAPLTAAPLPFLAVPTTAGTGAEATKNAVIGVPERARKVSLRDDRMIARVAIVDPALTDGCPRAVTLASGLDAVTQLIEPFLSAKATPYSDALSRPAIAPALTGLKRLMEGEDGAARDAMAWASLSGGLALANSGLGAVHGLSGPIGGLTGAAHGAICGTLLGPVLAVYRETLRGPARERLEAVFGMIAGALGGAAEDAPETLAAWARGAGLPDLSALGLGAEAHEAVIEAALDSSSMKGSPTALSPAHLAAALEAA